MTETMGSAPYIYAFLTERPKDGMDRIQSRLRSALKLNDEIADYFKERALLEDTYAKNLAKLNKKIFISDKQALGNLLPVWEKLQDELIDTSIIHAAFATNILGDIEKSLRSAIVTNQTYADIRSMDPTLQKLAKEYDDRQGKMIKQKKALEKNGKKPGDADIKYAEAKKQLDATKVNWQQNSVSYIQKFQVVDERRWSDIKNYLLQFESAHIDQMLKRVQLARDNLAFVNNFSVENEIISFCSQYTTNRNPSPSIPSTMPPLDTPMPPANGSETTESAPPSLLVDVSDDPVQPQSTVSTDSNTRKSTISSLPSATESVYNDKPDFNTQRRGSNAPSIASSKKSDKQRKFLSTLSIRLKPKSSSNNRANHLELPEFTTGNTSNVKDNSSIYSVQEEGSSEETKQTDQQSSVSSNTLQTPPALRKITSFSGSFFDQPSPSQSQQQQDTFAPNILVDAEGFSIPPPDRSPWTTEIEPTTSLAGDDQQDALPPRFKLDIKTNSVVQEDATSSQVALTRVASMLKESNPTTTAKRSRGRRELRSQLLLQGNTPSPGNTTPPPPLSCASSTVPPEDCLITPTTNSAISDDPITVNNTSHETNDSPFDNNNHDEQPPTNGMYQLQCLSASPTYEEGEQHQQPALDISINEVVHAQLRQGQAQRVMVTGQVALLYKGQLATTPRPLRFMIKHNGTETTFLADCIQQMETTDEGVIYEWTPPPSGIDHGYMSCLHYRQRQDEPSCDSSGLVAPYIVLPRWKCDGDQARLIVKFNKSTTATSKTVNQVMMVTHIGGECHGAQSMPPGQWLVDQQRMIWSLVDSEGEQVIRAKFATASQATPQPIAVRFEMQHQLASNLQVVEHAAATSTSGTWAKINKVDMNAKSGKYIAEV